MTQVTFQVPSGTKSFDVTPSDEGARVSARHSLFGVWEFTVKLPAEHVLRGLERMKRGDLVQDVFSQLDADTRDLFLVPASIYDIMESDDDDAQT